MWYIMHVKDKQLSLASHIIIRFLLMSSSVMCLVKIKGLALSAQHHPALPPLPATWLVTPTTGSVSEGCTVGVWPRGRPLVA